MARLDTRSLVLIAFALMALPAPALDAQALSGEFTVLIPDFVPRDGAQRKFGEAAAEALRQHMDGLPTHESISRKDLDKNIKSFKLDRNTMGCVESRQLAAMMTANLALCASYAPDGDQYRVEAEFWDIASGESFGITPQTVASDGSQAAADHIFGEFDRYTQQLRAAGICADYAGSRQWDAALQNCDKALTLNPKAVATRYQRAFILYQAERLPEALEELERVLEQDPIHEDALQLAGYLAAVLGMEAEALDYYNQYLALKPGSASVRMKIAYELAQAGDPAGAAQLIQVGLDQDPTNIDLWEQLGGFSYAAGQRIDETETPSPGAVVYYRQAIEAYQKVYAAKGAETPASELRSIMAALVRLGESDQAVAVGEQAVKTHSDDAALWSTYADALQKAGRLADAVSALEKVRSMDPAYPNLDLRQAKWLLDAGRTQESAAILKVLATNDPAQADAAARMVFADAYAKGVQPKKWSVAEGSLSAIRDIPNLSAGMKQQVDFWLGWSIFQGAVAQQEPRTLETAQATLPKFQRAKELFGAAGTYPATVKVDVPQLLENIGTFIDIQESIIKRGR